MIFYSWIALGQSDPTARNKTDPIAPSESDRIAPSESDRIAPSESDRIAPSATDRITLSEGDRTALGHISRMALSRIGWSAPGGAPWAGVPVAMGITDDRSRAMKAGEEALGTGRAAVIIIEAVRPGMAAPTLAPCYLRTGVGWIGRPTPGGEVAWDRFFL
jgi:hypothetical protein